jgi:hypothetical protein
VGSAAFSFINAKNKKYVELKYRQIIWEVFAKESWYCTNYSQRKNAASVGNKITEKGIWFRFAINIVLAKTNK